jgi:hypothetical protein
MTDDPDQPLHPRRRADPGRERPKAKRRDVDMLLEAAWHQGCDIVQGGNNHFKVYTADGTNIISVPATPSGYRTVQNKRSQLKRFGIDPNNRG